LLSPNRVVDSGSQSSRDIAINNSVQEYSWARCLVEDGRDGMDRPSIVTIDRFWNLTGRTTQTAPICLPYEPHDVRKVSKEFLHRYLLCRNIQYRFQIRSLSHCLTWRESAAFLSGRRRMKLGSPHVGSFTVPGLRKSTRPSSKSKTTIQFFKKSIPRNREYRARELRETRRNPNMQPHPH